MPQIKIHNKGYNPYEVALKEQQELFQKLISAKQNGLQLPNHLLLNIHEPVITLGLHAKNNNVLLPANQLADMGIKVFQTQRGGDVTYHGPGQWTIYPILDLESIGIGVREYVFRLEQVVLDMLAQYGIRGERISGAAGVWVRRPDAYPEKVCAVGIRCSHFVTMHGIALNVNTYLPHFRLINPCGYTDKGVTSLAALLGQELDMNRVAQDFIAHFIAAFNLDMAEPEI